MEALGGDEGHENQAAEEDKEEQQEDVWEDAHLLPECR